MPPNRVFSDVVFSPDSGRFLTCDERNLRVWDAHSMEEAAFSPLKHSGSINEMNFSADGRTLVAACDDFTSQVWDATTGQLLLSPPVVRHTGRILAARISPDGRSFVTAGEDAVARLWNTRTGQPCGPPLKHILHVKGVAYNADGRRLLTKSCDQAARVWDMATSDVPVSFQPELTNERRLISPNGQHLLLRGESNSVWIADARSGRQLIPLPHPYSVTYASFTADGRTVITACENANAVSSMVNDIFLGCGHGPTPQYR
jgi:WD40 repeat protein